MQALRILLADDHTLVRQGLRKLIEEQPTWQVVAEAKDGRDAVRLAEECSPDVAIIDVAMPSLNGIEATRQIVRRGPSVKVLVLSMHADDLYLTRALEAGALGYLLKDSADVDLFEAVSAVAEGRPFFSPAVSAALSGRTADGNESAVDRYETLSGREREVFQLVAECKTNKQIAAVLAISPTTVETHRAHIMEKLDLHSAAEFTLLAFRRGIIR